MTARNTLLLVAALCTAFVGCSHNPGYFPYLIPGGPINESHAKPGGRGYFRNFDPKACRLEVTPNQQITVPLGSQVVLVGTVMDKDGDPRRSRRVEWLIDGPGNIVEADESGVFPGRGYKVDNKYAVTYTNYVTKTITRGNTDAGDDVIVAPGQTFCVLSSAVPGETVVTAYAPEVFNWENGRVVVKILWGDGRFTFPAPAIVKYGGETTLTTTVSSSAAEGVPSGYRIRYKVLEGPPAVLVSRAGTGTSASQSGNGSKEAEAFTDANGEAAVRLVQQSPKAGKTRVAVEIVKPPENGTGAGTVVSRRETIIEWAEPRIHLAVNAPNSSGIGGTFPVTVSLDNEAEVDSRDARVKITLSDGATLARSEPPPSRQDANGALTFDLPPVGGKSKQEITLDVKPSRLGPVTVSAEVVTADGLSATNKATTRIDQGKLQLHVEGPSIGLVGEQIPFKIAVTNNGAIAAENVTVWARFDDGLRYAAPANPVELAVGTMTPGQTKTIDLPLAAIKAGRFGVRATATADGNLSAASEAITVDVRRAELSISASGPRLVYVNQDLEWSITVRNTGDAAVSNVVVRANIPNEVQVKSTDGKAASGSVEWSLPELRSGEQKTYRIPATATKLSDGATLKAAVIGDAMSGSHPVGDPITAKSESAVAIIGTPAVSLEVLSPPGLLEVGKRATFKVRVKNQGTVSARNVEVAAFAPPELRPSRGTSSVQGNSDLGAAPLTGRIEGTGRVAFPVLEELRPGETLLLTIEVDAVQAGDARFRVEVSAAHLTSALKEEQSARVTAK